MEPDVSGDVLRSLVDRGDVVSSAVVSSAVVVSSLAYKEGDLSSLRATKGY